MFDKELIKLSTDSLQNARNNGFVIATAESCTGGLIAGLFTEIAGSSDVFDRGFVTYSNEAKNELINVPMDIIIKHGAVSPETAHKMAEGVISNSNANISISVTGIAGPTGGSDDKPVGLVYIGISNKKTNETQIFKNIFKGNRSDVRVATIRKALELMNESING